MIYALFLALTSSHSGLHRPARFYRRKYDTKRTLEAFSSTLRNEVDLDQLREHLLAVVQGTMQPEHLSLWLRTPQNRRLEAADEAKV